MAAITAEIVKNLREQTGAGMLDCKKALDECGGDIEKATDWLRKKGLSAAAKKSGRVAAEGLVGVMVDGGVGTLIEINAETDFVARNELFQQLVEQGLQLVKQQGDDVATLAPALQTSITNLIAVIGENMALRRAKKINVASGVIAAYTHGALKPGLGKIGVLVALESSGDKNKLQDLGKKLAMHIAAQSPAYLTIDAVPAAVVAREKS
ncbi:MAG: translation elongation factor Ts, partial [Alphaproteobacteria bacterium]|nr:translation elongation factor Ts [Alphaproteobacteria bacterium]